MKLKKISSILSLLAIAQPMINNNQIFAKEVHDSKISENEVKNLDAKVKSKSDDKKETLNPNEGEKDVDKKDGKKADIKKRNGAKTAAIVSLATLLLGGLAVGGTLAGRELYLHRALCEMNWQYGRIDSCTFAKYMDTQHEQRWCQLYAFQGILNKEFGIKPKIKDLYELAFPGDKSYDEKKFMQDEDARKQFFERTINKYGISAKPYIKLYDMKIKLTEPLGEKCHKTVKIDELLENAMQKCGSVCININGTNEHAVLMTELCGNDGGQMVTFESYGVSYKMPLGEFVDRVLFNSENKSKTPGDCKHDGILRIYGFEK